MGCASPTSPWSIDYFADLTQGDAQRQALCARHNQDLFAKWYCQAQAPAVTNVMEIAAFDPNVATLHFYALHLTHACDDYNSCGFADHFGPADEANWSSVTAYDEIDLRNTAMDCLRCHESGGHDWVHNVGTKRQLLMQEGGKPWPHWMRSDTDSAALLDIFRTTEAAADAGITAPANLDVKTLVTFKCGTCHNGRFPGVGRNNFDVHDFPDNLSASMRAAIIDRLGKPDNSAQRMPPAIFGDLTADEQSLITGACAP